MWAADYVGIPYKDRGRDRDGADCWGIAWMVHRDIFGNDIPILHDTYETVYDLELVEMAYHDTKEVFQSVEFTNRGPGDILMFRIKGIPVHVGVAVDQRHMLHSLPGRECVYERYDSINWQRRVEGVYRWVS